MALFRNHGERGHAALGALLGAALILAGCDTATEAGWSSDGAPGTPIERVEIASTTDTILVSVDFPAEHGPADGFDQLATLQLGSESVQAPLTDDLQFELDVPRAAGIDGQLELRLGYCHKETPEVCYIDMPVVQIVAADASDSVVALRYLAPLP